MKILRCSVCGKLAPFILQTHTYQQAYANAHKQRQFLELPILPLGTEFCWGGGEDTYFVVEKEVKVNAKNKLSVSLMGSLVGFNGQKNCDKSNPKNFIQSYKMRKQEIIEKKNNAWKKELAKNYLEELIKNEDEVEKFISKLLGDILGKSN